MWGEYGFRHAPEGRGLRRSLLECVDAACEVLVGVTQVIGIELVGQVADGGHDPVGVSHDGVVLGRLDLVHLADDAAQFQGAELDRDAVGGLFDALEGVGQRCEFFTVIDTAHVSTHNKYPFLKVRAI